MRPFADLGARRSSWDRFVSRCQQALGELAEGRPEPFKAIWSHSDDVVIIGAFGGYERGWQEASARLDWAAKTVKATARVAENVVTVAGDDVGYIVDLEHMTRHAGDHPQPRTLRCTQVYRREGGEWKVVLRKSRVTWRLDNTWAQSRSCMTGDRTNHVQTFCLRY